MDNDSKDTIITDAVMSKMSLTQAKARYGKYGFCAHEKQFEEKIQPYGTDVVIVECGVCGKRKSKVYV